MVLVQHYHKQEQRQVLAVDYLHYLIELVLLLEAVSFEDVEQLIKILLVVEIQVFEFAMAVVASSLVLIPWVLE